VGAAARISDDDFDSDHSLGTVPGTYVLGIDYQKHVMDARSRS
jgi:hypothetical protein